MRTRWSARARAVCTSWRDVRDDVQARGELSQWAPRIITMQINPEKIGEIIGPKGKTIRAIQEETGAQISIDDSGLVTIASVSGEGGERARRGSRA
jgi:polyribonucleotide nucleotidyltransferase